VSGAAVENTDLKDLAAAPQREGTARSYSGISARRAFGRTGGLPFRPGPDGSRSQTPFYPGEKPAIDARYNDPNDIGKDMREVMNANTEAAEHPELIHDPSIGHYSATSSGRLAQKILDKQFQLEHNVRPQELENLKGNLRLLIEGNNIVRHGARMIDHEEFKKAMGIIHAAHKQWGSEIQDEQKWNAIVKKLLALAGSSHDNTIADTASVDVVVGGRSQPHGLSLEEHTPQQRESPENLPLEPEHKNHFDLLSHGVDSPHHPDFDTTRAILGNAQISTNEKFREISKLLSSHQRERFSIPVGNNKEIVFTKLQTGPGIFVKLPGDPYAKNFFSPKTVTMIEKLLLNRHN